MFFNFYHLTTLSTENARWIPHNTVSLSELLFALEIGIRLVGSLINDFQIFTLIAWFSLVKNFPLETAPE